MTDSASGSELADAWLTRASVEDPWRRKRPVILVAEDEASDQELMRRALQRIPEDCDVHIVGDGVELIEYLEGRGAAASRPHPAPDLMIIDLKMPRKDGRQAMQAITDDLHLTTPVVIFSSSDDRNDVLECYRAGCNSYVTKPIDLRQFNEVVQLIAIYWLRLSRLPQ